MTGGGLTPPAAVVAECRRGMDLWRSVADGATAPAVAHATAVMSGAPLTDAQVDQMAAAFAEIDRLLAAEEPPPAWLAAVTLRLWGGSPGRDWLATRAAAEPVLAAVSPPPRLTATERKLSRAAGELDRATVLRVDEAIEGAVTAALARVANATRNRLARPSGPLLAALGDDSDSRARRDAALALVDDEHPLASLAAPVLAALDLDTEALLAPPIQRALADRLTRILTTAQAAAAALWEEAGFGLDPSWDATAAEDAERAVAYAVAAAADAAARAAVDTVAEDGPGEPVDGHVPMSVAATVVAIAGGTPGNPAEVGQVTVPVGAGRDVLAGTGIAFGPTILAAVAAVPDTAAPVLARPSTGRTAGAARSALWHLQFASVWVWGRPARPFPPHQRLDGVSWVTEEERQERCANPGDWPAVQVLAPGDHRGCTCWVRTGLVPRGD